MIKIFESSIRNRIYFAIIILVLVYYAIISINTVQWGDSGYYLNRIINGPMFLITLHPMGHHVYQFFAKIGGSLFGIYFIFAFNSICLLASLFFMYKVAIILGKGTKPKLVYFLGFMLLHVVAFTTIHVEVYSLHLLLYVLGLYFLFQKSLRNFFLSGLFFSLSFGCHQMTGLVIPILFFWLIKNKKLNQILILVFGFSLGLAFLFSSFWHFKDLGLFQEIRMFLTGASHSSLGWQGNLFSFLSFSPSNLLFLGVALFSLINPATFGFVINASKTKEIKLLKWVAWIFLFFALTYNFPDKFTFLLPFLSIATILSSINNFDKFEQNEGLILVVYLLPIVVSLTLYFLNPKINAQQQSRLKNLELRDEFLYYGFPWIKDNSSTIFAVKYFNFTQMKYPIYADYNVASCLRSAQISYPEYIKETFLAIKSKSYYPLILFFLYLVW